MDERTWEYLSLLDENDPNQLRERLTDLLRRDPDVEVLSEDGEGGDLDVPMVGSLVLESNCQNSKQQFFRWYSDQLSRRRDHKYDELTGLYTRSYWERELRPTVRQESWSVAMGDIDHFKRFNDEHGHDMGDRVLESVGALLREECPDSGYLVRYGGEEVLILLSMEFSSAIRRLDSFRERLADERLFPEQPSRITMSIGMSEHDSGTSVEESIKRADQALYESKGGGRNQLTTYAPYLDHENRLYTWGMYRYIWSPGVRFCLASEGLEFLLYWGNALQWYDWGDNESIFQYLPSELTTPIRSIHRYGERFIILDSDGELWLHEPGDSFDRFTDDDTPAVVQLTGPEDELHAVGVNNQLYTVEPDGLRRRAGLPPRWEDLVVDGEIYVVLENILIEWTEGGSCVRSWPLPESPRQVRTSGDTLVLVGESGRLFQFDPDLHRWEQSHFENMIGGRLPCRDVSTCENRMLILDEHGRLLLVYRGGDRTKSVPQEMNLRNPRSAPPDGTVRDG